MKLNNYPKYALLSITLLFVIYLCVDLVVMLDREEDVIYRTDLIPLVPTDSKNLFVFNDLEYIMKFQTSFVGMSFKDSSDYIISEQLSNLFTELINLRLLLSEKKQNEILLSITQGCDNINKEIFWYKLNPGKEKIITTLLSDKIFKTYPPVEEAHSKAKVLHFALADGNFFSCYLFEGVFCGSFNPKLFSKALKQIDSEKSLRDIPEFKTAEDGIGKYANFIIFMPVNEIFLYNHDKTSILDTLIIDRWVATDVYFSDTRCWFSSSLPESKNPAAIVNRFIGQHKIRDFNPALLNQSTQLALHLSLSDQNRFSNSLRTNKCLETDTSDHIWNQYASGDYYLSYVSSVNKNLKESISRIIAIRVDSIHLFINNPLLFKNHIGKGKYCFKKGFSLSTLPEIFSFHKPVNMYILDNYCYLSDSDELLTQTISDLRSGKTFEQSPLYKNMAENIDSESTLFILGSAKSLITHSAELNFGLPSLCLNNKNTFLKSDFCINLIADSSKVYVTTLITK